MTKYINSSRKNKVAKETVFTHLLDNDKTVRKTIDCFPTGYDTVELLGTDSDYGAVFKAYNDTDAATDFILFFGITGDEFNQ